jgi:hypothetical protein
VRRRHRGTTYVQLDCSPTAGHRLLLAGRDRLFVLSTRRSAKRGRFTAAAILPSPQLPVNQAHLETRLPSMFTAAHQGFPQIHP